MTTEIKIPTHVALIMDGNGRWASSRGLPRAAGHKAGSDVVKKVLRHLKKRGVKVVTLYAFSSENWGRLPEEVETLLKLFQKYLDDDVKELMEEGARISFIGDRERFPADMAQKMTEIEAKTAENKEFRIVLAMSYGARDDILSAVKRLAVEVAGGRQAISGITAEVFSNALSTHGIPDPDFVIRTSGEERLSNFLLWEVAYSEFYWSPVFWPDFNEKEVDKALEIYAGRKRRFGKI